MFESLSDRLQAVFQKLGSKGRLTEDDVREGMKQVRLALLEADVNYKVVKDFVSRVTEQAIGEGPIGPAETIEAVQESGDDEQGRHADVGFKVWNAPL